MRDIADDCLPAFVHCDVLHADGLLASAPVSLERLHLCRERPGELIEGALRTVLLRNIVHMSEPAEDSQYSDEESTRRMNEALRRALTSPPNAACLIRQQLDP